MDRRDAAALAVFALALAAGSAALIGQAELEAIGSSRAEASKFADGEDFRASLRLEAGASALAKGLRGLGAAQAGEAAKSWGRAFGASATARDRNGSVLASVGPAVHAGAVTARSAVAYDPDLGSHGLVVEASAERPGALSAPIPGPFAFAPLAGLLFLGALCCSALGWQASFRRSGSRAAMASALACAGVACACGSAWWAGQAQALQARSAFVGLSAMHAAGARASDIALGSLPKFAASLPGRPGLELEWSLKMGSMASELPAGASMIQLDPDGSVSRAWGPEAFSARSSPAPDAGRSAISSGAQARSTEDCGALSMPCSSVAEPLAGGGALVVQRRLAPSQPVLRPSPQGSSWWLPPVALSLLLGFLGAAGALCRPKRG